MRCPLALGLACAALIAAARGAGAQQNDPEGDLRREVEALRREVEELRRKAQGAPAGAKESADEALDRALEELSPSPAPRAGASATSDFWSRETPAGTLRLIDVSLDVLAAAGGSSERNGEIELLQGGGHDPKRRGFTLQQAELSLIGAVDPYFRAEGHLVYFVTPDGESVFELEEAFFQTLSLPFGLQLEGGHFYTEFGRLNPRHPHEWAWLDQPIVNTRMFGADGMRGPGVRIGWLTPLPWFSELHVGAQNAEGAAMASFVGEGFAHGHGDAGEEEHDHAFEETIAGRPIVDRDIRSLEDFVYLARWVNGGDLTSTLNVSLGLSALFGPNNTGDDGKTRIYGADLVAKWRPEDAQRGWPFVVWQTEVMLRDFRADRVTIEDEDDPAASFTLGRETIRDWGLYTQVLWGFTWRWAVGLRYEFARGVGDSFEEGEEIDRDEDPFRDERHRVSPLLVWHPTEFSRLRLQYNWDRADRLSGDDAHSLWVGVEVLFGAHPAHAY